MFTWFDPGGQTVGENPTDTDVWNLILDPAIINMSVVNTNVKLTAMRQNLGENANKSNYRITDKVIMLK